MRKGILLMVLILALVAGGCANKAQTGAAGGALGGAAIGALLSGNKVQGAAIGAGVGMLLGYIVGNEWDKSDSQKLNHALENQPSGQTSSWKNPDTGRYYAATPEPAYTGADNRTYRDVYIETTDADGKPQKVKAKAYRNPDGTWQMVQ
jgi:Surface antigen